MKSLEENNDIKFERKHNSGRTNFLSFLGICDLRKKKTINGKIVLNLKFKKQIYVDRYDIFRNKGYDTKSMRIILAGKPKKEGTKRNKKDLIDKTVVKMIKFEF